MTTQANKLDATAIKGVIVTLLIGGVATWLLSSSSTPKGPDDETMFGACMADATCTKLNDTLQSKIENIMDAENRLYRDNWDRIQHQQKLPHRNAEGWVDGKE